MQPAVLTFRPDNFLTVGLIVLIGYTIAVLIAQGLMRAGIISPAAPASATAIPPGQVAVA